jgi:threonine synthase
MSEVQRRQMTTVDSPNVFTLRVNGSFDDCQSIVKEAFNERSFLKEGQFLLAVNSINWVRIIGQICYYFYASLKITNYEESLNFSVPTGNFGNVFACYSAHKMGMPLNKILVAVNENNILHRFFSDNDYSKTEVAETISPSMDISIASNFERLIYDFYAERDSKLCSDFYTNFPESPIKLETNMWNKSKDIFLSYCVNDISTLEAMKQTKEKYNYLIDPHTAVASEAVERISNNIQGKTIILSTAHPAKFPEVIKNANLKLEDIPNSLSVIFKNEERAYNFPASKDLIFDFITKNNS